LEGAQEIFDGVSEDLLGGTGKAEDAKLPGAGIIPKPCPMERVGTEKWRETDRTKREPLGHYKAEREKYCVVVYRESSRRELAYAMLRTLFCR
jgi:hypothetical protein